LAAAVDSAGEQDHFVLAVPSSILNRLTRRMRSRQLSIGGTTPGRGRDRLQKQAQGERRWRSNPASIATEDRLVYLVDADQTAWLVDHPDGPDDSRPRELDGLTFDDEVVPFPDAAAEYRRMVDDVKARGAAGLNWQQSGHFCSEPRLPAQ
jgi:hypothetical protein